jgi:hypothetical protein
MKQAGYGQSGAGRCAGRAAASAADNLAGRAAGSYPDRLRKPPIGRRRRRYPGWPADSRGTITVEALLTLPLLLLLAVFFNGLILSVQALLILDHGLAAACRDLADASYILQQAEGLGLSWIQEAMAAPAEESAESAEETESAESAEEAEESAEEAAANGGDTGLAEALLKQAKQTAGELLARQCLSGYLRQHPALDKAIVWKKAVLPGNGETDQGEDVVLAVSLTPASLGGSLALLPKAWVITIQKQQKAWLGGRNLSPERGLEQAAGQKEKGPLVYITRWGTKYHRTDCRYLAKSKIPAYLNQLSAAYEGCLVCRPPERE